MTGAIDDNLGGVDLPIAAGLGIELLALGEGILAERVLPTEIIPIGHRQRQRDQIGILRELDHERICRRAGGAALAGEELEQRLRLLGGSLCPAVRDAHGEGRDRHS